MIVILIEIPQQLPLAKIAKKRQEGLTTKSAEGATEHFPLSSGAKRHYPAFTPKALNSKAQCRAVPCVALRSMAAHAGLWITHITEPQRGSTKGAPMRANKEWGIRNFSEGTATKDSKGPVDSHSDSGENNLIGKGISFPEPLDALTLKSHDMIYE